MQVNKIDPIKRPAIKWHGSKWRSAPWIISYIPSNDHHDVFVDAFGGSAAITLRKERSRIEVFNDLDHRIHIFFTQIRDNVQELIEAIRNTPYHILEYEMSYQPTDDPLEIARRFYVQAYQSIMGPSIEWGNSFRRQKVYSRGKSGTSSMKPAAHSFAEATHLSQISHRLRGIFFESMDALQLAKLYDSPRTVVYFDPPYLGSTRTNKTPQAYKHELFTDEDHIYFLNSVKRLQSIPLISGYDSELYRTHLDDQGWHRAEKPSRTNGPNARTEVLWFNEKTYDTLKD